MLTCSHPFRAHTSARPLRNASLCPFRSSAVSVLMLTSFARLTHFMWDSDHMWDSTQDPQVGLTGQNSGAHTRQCTKRCKSGANEPGSGLCNLWMAQSRVNLMSVDNVWQEPSVTGATVAAPGAPDRVLNQATRSVAPTELPADVANMTQRGNRTHW